MKHLTILLACLITVACVFPKYDYAPEQAGGAGAGGAQDHQEVSDAGAGGQDQQ